MDIKSATVLGLALGLTLGGGVVLASYIAVRAQPWPMRLNTQQQPIIGRYQLSGVPGNAYVLDTATGEVWEDFTNTNAGAKDGQFKRVKLR
ncbi:MAG: hypothetical protein C0478_17070 [Planctomyces sp.]|jgi:hypothetical protein|nr:hypothetical protein [Planctomyces sp.]